MSEELVIAIVCEKMGWTYQEYMSQPDWFIMTLLVKWNEEAIYQNEKNKDAK